MIVNPVLALLRQTPAPTGAGGGSLLPFLFQVVAIFGIFYFIMIRPQQKQRRAHEERLRSLKRGDRVVTAGGIIAEVMAIKGTPGASGESADPKRMMEDEVTIRTGESRLVVERGRIARVLGEQATADPTGHR
jgi:preprotein translocase subunit YajC